MNVFVLDNYDSFTYILVQYLGELGVNPVVELNDRVTVDDVLALNPDVILVSPGPGRPENAGISIELVKRASGTIPLLGVCLGHQSIVEAFGGRTTGARRLMHGKTCAVQHDGAGLFANLPNPTVCMRYHSLIADPSTIPTVLNVVARTDDEHKEVMAIAHRSHPTWGVQFHPESIGTAAGMQMIKNFLTLIRKRSNP